MVGEEITESGSSCFQSSGARSSGKPCWASPLKRGNALLFMICAVCISFEIVNRPNKGEASPHLVMKAVEGCAERDSGGCKYLAH